MRKILCFLGFHKLGWYSEYDQDLFLGGQDTGSLVECLCGCGFYSRVENGSCGWTLAKNIKDIATAEQIKQNYYQRLYKQ